MSSESQALAKLLQLAQQQEIDLSKLDLGDESANAWLRDLGDLEQRIKHLDTDHVPEMDFDVAALLRKLADIEESGLLSSESPALEDFPNLESRDQSDSCYPEPSEVLGEYDLFEVIGRGGVGTVFRGRHRLLQRDVAIKRLRSDREKGTNQHTDSKMESCRLRFLREMKVVARLHCPHVVAATDARIVDGQVCLMMELVQGKTFGQWVKRDGSLPVADACESIRQACVGLNSIHSLGLVHRDIKPSNLMLRGDGVVKILDLGLVSLRHATLLAQHPDMKEDHPSLTAPGTVMGTVDYVSPEQIDDARAATPQSDIYSLGCVFYFLLTGQPPFNAKDYPSDVIRLMAHLSVVPKRVTEHRSDVPTEIADLIEKMLAKNSHDRPEGAQQIAEQLTP